MKIVSVLAYQLLIVDVVVVVVDLPFLAHSYEKYFLALFSFPGLKHF